MICNEFDPECDLMDDEVDEIELAMEDILEDDGSDIDNIGGITDDIVASFDDFSEEDLEEYTDDDYEETPDVIEYEYIEDDPEEDVQNDIQDIEDAVDDFLND